MARQEAAVQVNQFIGGFNTEANPLNFPLNSSQDELNLKLNTDGSREKRVGFDVEFGFSSITVPVSDSIKKVGRNHYTWDSPGGFSQEQFVVVQLGKTMNIHRVTDGVVSTAPIFTRTFVAEGIKYGISSFDNYLVVVVGDGFVYTYEYTGSEVLEKVTRLKTRDLFGVYDGLALQDRPSTIRAAHVYNLRNQTFGPPRVVWPNEETLADPISMFHQASVLVTPTKKINGFFKSQGTFIDPENEEQASDAEAYPSNADSVIPYLYANPNHDSNRTVERYHAKDAYQNTPYASQAPMGHFIIDVLSRGTSRLEEDVKLRQRNGDLIHAVSRLPRDTTVQGATTLVEYAGRMWYAGFGSEVEDGDVKSPKLSRFVFFSQYSTTLEGVAKCYQEADPTSHVDSDLVDTDGGFIKIGGADNIIGLEVVGKSLLVFADNGVWRIVGSEENSFSATNYSVELVSSYGCTSVDSIVSTGSVAMYWADSSIYLLEQDNVSGQWSATDMTSETIKTYYTNLTPEQRVSVFSFYDRIDETIIWGLSSPDFTETKFESLNFHTKFQAFTKYEVQLGEGVAAVCSVSGLKNPTSSLFEEVTVGGEVVTVGGEAVYTRSTIVARRPESPIYLVILSRGNGEISYTFGNYIGGSRDWDRVIVGGLESEAFLITGLVSGGDSRLRKDIPYLTLYLENYGELGSSCKLSAQWDWSHSSLSNKWTREREGYRYNTRQEYSDLVVTRNALRGSGQTVAIKLTPDPSLPFKIYGWDFNLKANARE